MPIRWKDGTNFVGYGVTGGIFQPVSTDPLLPGISALEINLRTIAEEVTLQPGGAVNILSIAWRFTLAVISTDMSAIKRYNVQSGKSQLATWTTSAYNYISSDGFMSYESIISPRYRCAFRYINGQDDEEAPSSEPQDEIDTGEYQAPGIYCYLPLGFVTTDTIADKANIFFERGVLLVRWGCTYWYEQQREEAASVADLGASRVIVL